jgi:uroporphyrinogen decarboxylase
MTPRQRFIETLTFGQPDRTPFEPGGPRESTLQRWRQEGLPAGVSWRAALLEEIGVDPAELGGEYVQLDVDFRLVPQFDEKVLEKRNGHLIVQDWKGNVCEISDEFDVSYLRSARDFVTRRWIRCPVETRDDWERMKSRYDVEAGGRFPSDFEQQCADLRDRTGVLRITWPGPFWQLREWVGFEELCMMTIEDPEWVDEMADFWTDFAAGLLGRILDRVTPDAIWINEDMAYKGKSMISPEMVRRFCKPSYDRWAKMAIDAGVPVRDVDSDGFIGELIPIWIESGWNVCDPIEVAAGNDINEFRAEFGRSMAYRGGVDKRAIAAGGTTLHEEMDRIEPVVRDGGYIPGCDHGVPSDISWRNFIEYSRRLAQMTGWL